MSKQNILEVGSLMYHPLSMDIIEFIVISATVFDKGLPQYRLKATGNVGACGKVEVIISGNNGKYCFIGVDEHLYDKYRGLDSFIEGEYFTSKDNARLEYYNIQLSIARENMDRKERLYNESKDRYNQVCNIINQIK